MTQIYIHAGAHRTGTSSFQACLAANADALRGIGIDTAYPGRDGIDTGTLALRLPHPRDRRSPDDAWVTSARSEIARHRTGSENALILSEENILGRMFHFYKGAFYPAARRRATILARALPGTVDHIVFVTRSYDELFTSAYRKRAEDNAVPSFDSIAPRMVAIDRGWPEVVTILRNRLKPKTFTVLDYRSRGNSSALLARLVPPAAAVSLVEPQRALNLSATDRALTALQTRYHAGERLARPDWQAVIADHAGDSTDLGFAQFSLDQQAELRGRYAADLERLRVMQDITFIP